MNRTEILKAIDRTLSPVAALAGHAGSLLFRFRSTDPRTLILRPGGMGDLILCCVAAEDLGLDPKSFLWLIEERSSVWAKHLGLDYLCYDRGFLAQHWKIAGRFKTVVNSEQLFGLSQASAKLACARDATLVSFKTNRASRSADITVDYDADRMYESLAFRNLLVIAHRLKPSLRDAPVSRARKSPASEKPVVGLAGLQAESRTFSEHQWDEFIRSRLGTRAFWIAASPADRAFAERLRDLFPYQAEIFMGGFGDLCGVIATTSEVLTVDGGFLHIASYYGVPATAIFTAGRNRKWAPLAPGSCIIRRPDLACQPCTWFGTVPPCPNNFACKDLDFQNPKFEFRDEL